MEREEKNIYEKKNHHCGGSHRRYFGGSCGYLNFSTDTGTDLTIPHCPCENSSGCSLCRNTAFTGQRQNRKWDDNPAFLIENALSPAKVILVAADEEAREAQVIVPDYQLSLAIGKEGQNARLAARLTGFKIDIKSETQARESGDFLDYENDYEEDEYYDEDGGSYEEYEDGSAPAEEGYEEDSYETDGAEENNAEADGEDRE